jgi:hypothetical protein
MAAAVAINGTLLRRYFMVAVNSIICGWLIWWDFI